jgi:hypothetical protein
MAPGSTRAWLQLLWPEPEPEPEPEPSPGFLELILGREDPSAPAAARHAAEVASRIGAAPLAGGALAERLTMLVALCITVAVVTTQCWRKIPPASSPTEHVSPTKHDVTQWKVRRRVSAARKQHEPEPEPEPEMSRDEWVENVWRAPGSLPGKALPVGEDDDDDSDGRIADTSDDDFEELDESPKRTPTQDFIKNTDTGSGRGSKQGRDGGVAMKPGGSSRRTTRKRSGVAACCANPNSVRALPFPEAAPSAHDDLDLRDKEAEPDAKRWS